MNKYTENPDKAEKDPDIHGIRINKFLSSAGVCSRRAADTHIANGEVKINGQIADLGSRVKAHDQVEFQGQRVRQKNQKKIYIALNKPAGIVCTTDKKESRNVIDFIGYPERIYPIGRLDKDSEGLLLLTNDGDIVNKILRARYGHEKEYIVEVNKEIDEDFKERMETGVRILGRKTLPTKLKIVKSRRFRIILKQGLNRQIRRMCEALGYEVTYLQRIRMMNVTLGNLQIGEWRYLTYKEMQQLLSLIDDAIVKVDGEDDAI